MNIKTLAIIIFAVVLVLGIFKFLNDQSEKREGSSNYIQKSIKSVERVEALNKEREMTILEHERELESWQ